MLSGSRPNSPARTLARPPLVTPSEGQSHAFPFPAGDRSGSIDQTVASALGNADWIGALRNSGVQQVDFFGDIHGVGNGWGILLSGRGDGAAALAGGIAFPLEAGLVTEG